MSLLLGIVYFFGLLAMGILAILLIKAWRDAFHATWTNPKGRRQDAANADKK
jgi:hypothetical protein